jgi:hypothetical protein
MNAHDYDAAERNGGTTAELERRLNSADAVRITGERKLSATAISGGHNHKRI